MVLQKSFWCADLVLKNILLMLKKIELQTINKIMLKIYYYWPNTTITAPGSVQQQKTHSTAFVASCLLKLISTCPSFSLKSQKYRFLCRPYNRMKGANLLNSIIATRCKKHAWNMPLVLKNLSLTFSLWNYIKFDKCIAMMTSQQHPKMTIPCVLVAQW